MTTRYCISVALIVVALASPSWAETNLGIALQQGENGRPVVAEVIPKVGNVPSLGSSLQLKPGDEIYRAHSDPIRLRDGTLHQTWDIHSIDELRWVLARTNSRVGLTIKRDGKYVKAVALYVQVTEMRKTPTGEEQVSKRVLTLEVHEIDKP